MSAAAAAHPRATGRWSLGAPTSQYSSSPRCAACMRSLERSVRCSSSSSCARAAGAPAQPCTHQRRRNLGAATRRRTVLHDFYTTTSEARPEGKRLAVERQSPPVRRTAVRAERTCERVAGTAGLQGSVMGIGLGYIYKYLAAAHRGARDQVARLGRHRLDVGGVLHGALDPRERYLLRRGARGWSAAAKSALLRGCLAPVCCVHIAARTRCRVCGTCGHGSFAVSPLRLACADGSHAGAARLVPTRRPGTSVGHCTGDSHRQRPSQCSHSLAGPPDGVHGHQARQLARHSLPGSKRHSRI